MNTFGSSDHFLRLSTFSVIIHLRSWHVLLFECKQQIIISVTWKMLAWKRKRIELNILLKISVFGFNSFFYLTKRKKMLNDYIQILCNEVVHFRFKVVQMCRLSCLCGTRAISNQMKLAKNHHSGLWMRSTWFFYKSFRFTQYCT